MNSTEKYRYRRDHHLCVKCGEELPEGHTLRMCDTCRKFTHLRQNARYAKRSDEWKAAKREYYRKWHAEHPDKAKEYRERRKAKDERQDAEET